MTGPSGDPLVDRAIGELRRMPAVDDLAVRRIVTAAAAGRDSADADASIATRRRGGRARRRWIVAGLATAAAAAGFMVRGAWSTHLGPDRTVDASTSARPNAPSAAPIEQIRMASGPAPDAAPIPMQFVLRNGAARRVSVVGDFNNWNPATARMTRSPGGDLWSVTIPVPPGRHTYGFMIDDTLFTLDPRAPRTRDPDLGVENSIIIVGRP